MFLVGNALQNQSHWLLAGLARPTDHTSKGLDAYRVPHGELQHCAGRGFRLASLHSSTEICAEICSNLYWILLRYLFLLLRLGGCFGWVSCPHYLGEIVIYIGLLLLQRGRRLNAWLILLWVVSTKLMLCETHTM